jgi:hypothetical protein
MKAKQVLPSESIGLDPNNIDERRMEERLYSYVARKGAATGQSQAPTPKGTVGPANKLRKAILQLSLFPDIHDNLKRVQHPGNIDFGEPHNQKS